MPAVEDPPSEADDPVARSGPGPGGIGARFPLEVDLEVVVSGRESVDIGRIRRDEVVHVGADVRGWEITARVPVHPLHRSMHHDRVEATVMLL
jgi:hypothetical protein